MKLIRPMMLCCLLVASGCKDDSTSPPEPVVDPGRMLVQISGAVQLTSAWSAFGEFRDLLASDTNELSLMAGQNLDFVTADSNLTLVFPGRLGAGQFAIGRYVPGVLSPGPAAFVVFDTTLYASVPGGTVNVTAADYPTRPGLTPGLLRGTIDFKAVRLVPGPSGPVETSDTITFHATFAPNWYHYLFPNVSVTLSGASPVVGTSTFTTAQSLDDGMGGRLVDWESDFGAFHGFPHDVSQELRVLTPSVGTFPIAPLTPMQFNTPIFWPARYVALFYRDDARAGFSTSGTVTITRFVTPTDEFYGEIQGTLTARLALWVNNTTVSADTANASITFAVQLWPLGGIPASVIAPPEARIGARTRAAR